MAKKTILKNNYFWTFGRLVLRSVGGAGKEGEKRGVKEGGVLGGETIGGKEGEH